MAEKKQPLKKSTARKPATKKKAPAKKALEKRSTWNLLPGWLRFVIIATSITCTVAGLGFGLTLLSSNNKSEHDADRPKEISMLDLQHTAVTKDAQMVTAAVVVYIDSDHSKRQYSKVLTKAVHEVIAEEIGGCPMDSLRRNMAYVEDACETHIKQDLKMMSVMVTEVVMKFSVEPYKKEADTTKIQLLSLNAED